MRITATVLLALLLTASGCRIDYDVEEVAPAEHLESGHSHNHSSEEQTETLHEHDHESGTCEECGDHSSHDDFDAAHEEHYNHEHEPYSSESCREHDRNDEFEALQAGDSHDHNDECTCEACSGHSNGVHEEQHEEFSSGPSGHLHASGDRNHGTQWFFNQPWAAPFIWSKLLRDGAIFLVLSVVLFFLTRRKNR
ncbi:hypothetical protein CSA37_08940 [Candidatus Fermentibacteria bacterium]|nr:MAG: hypothetical protein CSA37_08940 [Candidatus Fermentibacteria bacterium]